MTITVAPDSYGQVLEGAADKVGTVVKVGDFLLDSRGYVLRVLLTESSLSKFGIVRARKARIVRERKYRKDVDGNVNVRQGDIALAIVEEMVRTQGCFLVEQVLVGATAPYRKAMFEELCERVRETKGRERLHLRRLYDAGALDGIQHSRKIT